MFRVYRSTKLDTQTLEDLHLRLGATISKKATSALLGLLLPGRTSDDSHFGEMLTAGTPHFGGLEEAMQEPQQANTKCCRGCTKRFSLSRARNE